MPGERAINALRALIAQAQTHKQAAGAYEELALREAARMICADGSGREAFAETAKELPRALHAGLALEVCARSNSRPSFDELPKKEVWALTKSRFSALLRAAAADKVGFLEAEGFEDACELVSDGDASGCLLPISDIQRAPLTITRRLAAQYGLKKRRVFLLQDGEESAEFALYTAALYRGDGRYLELSLYSTGKDDVGTLTELCALCRLEITELHIDTLCRLVARGENKDLMRALAAAKLLFTDLSVDGYYDIYGEE